MKDDIDKLIQEYRNEKSLTKKGQTFSYGSLRIIELIKLGKSNSEIKDELRMSGLCLTLSNKNLSDRISYIRKKISV